MRKKRIIFISIAIIAVLSTVVAVYLKKKSDSTLRFRIHKTTNNLIKINSLKFLKTLDLKEAKNTLDSSKLKSVIRSIELPQNIYFFTVKNKKESTVFSFVKISDYKLFENSFDSTFERKEIGDNIKSLSDKEGKWNILYNKNIAVLSFSKEKENTQDILLDLINNQNSTSIGESTFKDIINQNDLFVIYHDKSRAKINIKDNTIVLEAIIDNPKIIIPKNITLPDFDKENALSFALQADIKSIFPKKIFEIRKQKINSEELLKHFNNKISLQITKPIAKKDSIISYDFDDNFEKVEVVKIREKFISGFNFSVNCDPEKTHQYLSSEGIINRDGKVNRQFFPLYELYSFKNSDKIIFSPDKDFSSLKIPEKKSDNFFFLKINFEKLQKEPDFDFMKKYTKNLKSLEATGKKDKQNKIVIHSSLETKSDAASKLIELVKKLYK